MNTLIVISQIIVAIGIYNVWLLRRDKKTAWRGGDAKTMLEEFHTYGLSTNCMRIVGVCKVAMATCLILGLWYRPLALVGASVMATLMLAAVMMHARVRDPLRKSLPASLLLLLCLFIVFVGP